MRVADATGGIAWGQLALVDWPAIAQVLPTLVMLVAFMVVIILTDTASLELALRAHLEPDQTLRTFGLANAAASLPGIPLVMSITGTMMAHRCGLSCRLVDLSAAATTLGIWLAGRELFALIPAFVIGGIGVYVGLLFLDEWVFQQWRRLNAADRAILSAVVAGVSLIGFAEGFMLGLLLGLLFFVVSCSRQPVSATRPPAGTASAMSSAPQLNRNGFAREATGSILSLAGSCSSGRPRASMAVPAPVRWRTAVCHCVHSSSISGASAGSIARAGTISARSPTSPVSTGSPSS